MASAAEASIPVWRLRSGYTPLEPTPPGPGLAVGLVCVTVKSAGQQAVLMLHRTRVLPIQQQTMLANTFRVHLAEFGIVVVQGIRQVRELIERVFAEDIFYLPALVRTALRPLVAQLMELRSQIKSIEKELLAWHRTGQESRRLETIPGVGFITATMEPLKL